jgi:hypothetical protein
MRSLQLLTGVALVLLCGVLPAHAQDDDEKGPAFLGVCNKGDVPVVAFAAIERLLRWNVTSTFVQPGHCEWAYEESDPRSHGAYIGIALSSGGPPVSQPLEPMPRWNMSQDLFQPEVQRGVKTVCVLPDRGVDYVLNDPFGANCRTLGTGSNAGRYVAVESSLFFRPYGMNCGSFVGNQDCPGGKYYLTVSPTQKDSSLHLQDTEPLDPEPTRDAAADAEWSKAVFQWLLKLADSYAQQKKLEQEEKARQLAATYQRIHAHDEDALRRMQADKETEAAIRRSAAQGDPNAIAMAQARDRAAEQQRQGWAGARLSAAGPFDVQWSGRTAVLYGTVARITVKTGYPSWVTVYFQESPDHTLVVCSPYPEIFQEQFGAGFATSLVGKTMEVLGPVEGAMCDSGAKASIKIVQTNQLRVH